MSTMTTLIHRFFAFLRWVFRRPRVEEDLRSDVREYIEMFVADRMSEGMDRDQALRLARMEIGGVEQTKERVRAIAPGMFVQTFFKDVQYAVRMLSRKPAFTAVAVLSLGVGITATTTMFSVVNGVLLRPLPYDDAERLVLVPGSHDIPDDGSPPIYAPPAVDWPVQNHIFEGVALRTIARRVLMDDLGARPIMGESVEPQFMSVLGTRPLLGRDFTAEDAGLPNAIVSYGFWQGRLGGAEDVIGSEIRFEEGTATVIGVMPPRFRSPLSAELWFAMDGPFEGVGTRVARLRPGFTVERAEAELNALIARIDVEYGSNVTRTMQVQSILGREIGGSRNRTQILMLFGSVGLLLLVAVVNVSNLLLCRCVGRQPEIAVRMALGGGRRRLIRQLLTESLVLASLGGLTGVLGTYGAMQAMLTVIPPTFPRLEDIYIDPIVLLFAVVVTLVASIGFGILPAMRGSRFQIQAAMSEGVSRSSESRRHRRVQQTFVGLQVMLATVLLIGAGLFAQSFLNLLGTPLGLDTENVIAADIGVRYRNPSVEASLPVYDQIISRIRLQPGVDTVSFGRSPIDSGTGFLGYVVEGIPEDRIEPRTITTDVSADYFRTLGMNMTSGRAFDDGEKGVVVNEAFVRLYWPEGGALGRRVMLRPGADPNAAWHTIVGVVEDLNHSVMSGFASSTPEIFRPCEFCATLLVKTRPGAEDVGSLIRAQVAAVDPGMPVDNIRSLDAALAANRYWSEPRFRTTLLGAFAGTALVLALSGIYGVAAYTVAARRREFAIRLALGASAGRVVGSALASGALPLLLGLASGLALSATLTRLTSSYLFEVTPMDPYVFSAVTAVFLAVAIAANYIPSRLAASADPMTTLRHE